jgi:lipoprotein-anchoring transpeptidase ErfK/SrfK
MGAVELEVSLERQRLDVLSGGEIKRSFPVSTSRLGGGETRGSFKTPRGRHVVRAKVGAGQPLGAVFHGRRPTGEIFSEALRREQPERDWILTRILWLSGTEVGRNRLGEVDTMRRFIYIHGTPETHALGVPASHGCIRMGNEDMLELFDLVRVGTPVEIG